MKYRGASQVRREEEKKETRKDEERRATKPIIKKA
jgi:hypothetical protein